MLPQLLPVQPPAWPVETTLDARQNEEKRQAETCSSGRVQNWEGGPDEDPSHAYPVLPSLRSRTDAEKEAARLARACYSAKGAGQEPRIVSPGDWPLGFCLALALTELHRELRIVPSVCS